MTRRHSMQQIGAWLSLAVAFALSPAYLSCGAAGIAGNDERSSYHPPPPADPCNPQPASDYCTTDYDCTPFGCESGLRKSCSQWLDCFASQQCRGGQCMSRCKTYCYSNNDCDTGSTCVDHKCYKRWRDCAPPDTSECHSNTDCEHGFECQRGDCEARRSCYLSDDCPNNYECEHGGCQKLFGASCVRDSDCARGEACNTKLKTCGLPGKCRSGANCAQGYHCMRSSCIVNPSCGTDDSKCPSGYFCSIYGCMRPGVHRVCRDDAQCKPGHRCESYGLCAR